MGFGLVPSLPLSTLSGPSSTPLVAPMFFQATAGRELLILFVCDLSS